MNNQISIFELIDDEYTLTPEHQKLRRAIRRGTGFAKGKERVYAKAKENLPVKDFANFLKKEYGYGGGSFEGGFVTASSKGFEITDKGWTNKKLYTWIEMANEIKNMIDTNQYFKE